MMSQGGAESVLLGPGGLRGLPRVARGGAGASWMKMVGFLFLHVPLALLMKHVPGVSTAHALGAVILGLVWAIADRPRQVALVGAYIASAEVLWRMTGAAVFWEFGKYGMALIFMVSILRSRRFRFRPMPLLYFVLLIPAVMPTLFKDIWWSARRDISFNLSGPFALMLAVMFFYGLKLSREDVRKMLIWLLAPLMGVVGIALTAVLSSTIFFGQSSNEAASGGFGPNQVSSAMGLGILVAFLGLMDGGTKRPLKLLFGAIILVFAMQSALTLSRSGLVIGLGCVLIASVFFVRSTATRLKLAGSAMVLCAVFYFVIYPRLDAFTGGAISARFHNTNSTGRDKIMLVDLQIWLRHPVLGVGVGQAQVEREKYYRLIAAHNEFTRLVAEHGLLGLASALLLLGIALNSLSLARGAPAKALVASMMSFSFAFMLANGMRMALVSFTFGFAAAMFPLPPLRRLRRLRATNDPAGEKGVGTSPLPGSVLPAGGMSARARPVPLLPTGRQGGR